MPSNPHHRLPNTSHIRRPRLAWYTVDMLIAYRNNFHSNASWSPGLGVRVSTKGLLPQVLSSSALVFTLLGILFFVLRLFYLPNLGPPVLYIRQTFAVEFDV